MADVLQDVIDRMDMPQAFKHGIRLTENVERKERKQKFELNVRKFAAPSKPDQTEFEFFDDGFRFRNKWCSMGGGLFAVLKALAIVAAVRS